MKQSKVRIMQLVAIFIASVMFASISGQAVSAATSSATYLNATSSSQSATSKTATSTKNQYKAFWFSYYDYSDFRSAYKNENATTFKSYFTKVVKKGKSLGMNRVIVQVRPFGDAMYKSKYFPWSKYISGTQGKNPGYDPLKIMVQVAHAQGMKIEAWVNPYRVTTGSTNYSKLSKYNQARKWHAKSSTKRNVLSYGGSLYYNPSKKAVRDLIVNGVKEIVKNYDVDGIHMDDYFYPSFSSSNYKKTFDATEYNKSSEKKKKQSIQTYRRKRVNWLVERLHKEVKKIDSKVVFGISPAGNISNLTSKYSYYVDIYTWLKSTKYVDYITPQIYWGFNHPTAKFDKVTRQWISARKNKKVKLYIGIAVYRAGHYVGQNKSEKKEWRYDTNVLKKQVQYGRKKNVDGFAFFDYQDLHSSASKKAVTNLATVLK